MRLLFRCPTNPRSRNVPQSAKVSFWSSNNGPRRCQRSHGRGHREATWTPKAPKCVPGNLKQIMCPPPGRAHISRRPQRTQMGAKMPPRNGKWAAAGGGRRPAAASGGRRRAAGDGRRRRPSGVSHIRRGGEGGPDPRDTCHTRPF